MKFWKATMAMLILACLAIVPVGCEEEYDTRGSTVGSAAVTGNWQLITSWKGGTVNANAGIATLDGTTSGSVTLSTGFSGTWNCAGYVGALFFLQFATPERPQYSGKLVTETRIEGTMRNNQSQSGTFYMTRL